MNERSIPRAPKCILCTSPIQEKVHPRADVYLVSCKICGDYEIDGSARGAFKTFQWGDEDQRYLLSARSRTALVRGAERCRFTMEILGQASRRELRDPSFQEKRDSMFDWFVYRSHQNARSAYGAKIPVDPNNDYPVAWCHNLRDGDWSEWNFIIDTLFEKRFLEKSDAKSVRISNAGWEYHTSRPKAYGSQGFIAIAFREDTANASAAIEAGISAAGYWPLRIDKQEYLGGVMDEIKARIRESRFVIADLTHNRGGVYHEAGFALGLNIPVILTCRHEHLEGDPGTNVERVHFDVRHLNMIGWAADKLGDLTHRIKNRIEAIFDHGPL
jgi:hypothetical protein